METTCRKRRRCDWCQQFIEPGLPMVADVENGRFRYMHRACAEKKQMSHAGEMPCHWKGNVRRL